MKHASLFSGIGGFDLAAQWMGWDNVFHCEWNPFGQKILKHYWPKAISYEDITKTDFSIHRGQIDILTGGFPCQPYSVAGKRKGKEDERHLWPEMLRAIREIQPSYIVGENVGGIVSWNRGMVFEEVQTDLEAEGYEVWPYILPAAGKNADHDRERIWFIAYSVKKLGRFSIQPENTGASKKWERPTPIGCENREQFELASDSVTALTKWANRPATVEFYDGISTGLDVEAFFRGSNNGYGNAIYPEVAFEIFIAIELINNGLSL
jgi:DNA (cytosine-5)-methyltransferase 1